MKKLFYLLCSVLMCLLMGCEPKEPVDPNNPSGSTDSALVKIETGDATDITQTSATVRGIIKVDLKKYQSYEFGIYYCSASDIANDNDGVLIEGKDLVGNEFTINLKDLTENTEYFYSAYLRVGDLEYELGDVKVFTTLASSGNSSGTGNPSDSEEPLTHSPGTTGIDNGFVYVDLGLSVKWATCNVGALSIKNNGHYFSWGEIKPKKDYRWETYEYGLPYGEIGLTKYCYNSEHGVVDNLRELKMEDDAAHVYWGGLWRMPTKEELFELRIKCDWEFYEGTDACGYIVTGPNGNSIFMPNAGKYSYESVDDECNMGYYWSSTLGDNSESLSGAVPSSYDAYILKLMPYSVVMDFTIREYGCSIRPVHP